MKKHQVGELMAEKETRTEDTGINKNREEGMVEVENIKDKTQKEENSSRLNYVTKHIAKPNMELMKLLKYSNTPDAL